MESDGQIDELVDGEILLKTANDISNKNITAMKADTNVVPAVGIGIQVDTSELILLTNMDTQTTDVLSI